MRIFGVVINAKNKQMNTNEKKTKHDVNRRDCGHQLNSYTWPMAHSDMILCTYSIQNNVLQFS